jgi:hypothetical protein
MKPLGALPTAIGTITRLAYARAQAAGIELEPLLNKAGLTKQQIEDFGTRLSVQRQISFLNFVASAVRDELLGFHLAQLPDLRELGLLYYVPASSEILGQALRRVARYSLMDNESLSLKYLEGNDIRIMIKYVGDARYLDRHTNRIQSNRVDPSMPEIDRPSRGTKLRKTHPPLDRQFFRISCISWRRH